MNNRKVTKETAKLCGEVGFDWWTEISLCKVIRTGTELIIDSRILGEYPNTYEIIGPLPLLNDLKDWLLETHNIEARASLSMELDIPTSHENTDVKEIIHYSYTVNNWNVRWSVHDGTGLVMPEYYHGEGDDYYDALEKGIKRGLQILLKEKVEI